MTNNYLTKTEFLEETIKIKKEILTVLEHIERQQTQIKNLLEFKDDASKLIIDLIKYLGLDDPIIPKLKEKETIN